MCKRKREQGQGYGNRRQAARQGNELTANGHDRTLPFTEIGDYRCAHTYVHMYVYICGTACDNYYALSLASSRFPLLAPPLNKTGYRREEHSRRD